MQVPRNFEGGPEAFFALLYSCRITGYLSIAPYLTIHEAQPLFLAAFAAAAHETLSFRTIFTEFLKGKGIPCPGLFHESRHLMSPIVDLDTVEEEGFRARMWWWAMTGVPSVEVGCITSEVRICGILSSDYTNQY